METKKEIPTITLGRLRAELAAFPDDCEVSFAGGLTWLRPKMRGEKHLNLEFAENVYRDTKGVWQVDAPE